MEPIDYKKLIAEKRAFFRGETPRNGLSAELTARFASLANSLSPENLHMDGEISATAANKRKTAILKEWKALEKEAGRKVPFSEFPF